MAQPDRQRSLTGFFNASTSSCISSLVFDGHLTTVPHYQATFFNASTSSCISSLVFDGHLTTVPHYQATASDLDKAFRWSSRLALLYRRCCYVSLPSTIHILSTRPNLRLQSHTSAGTIQYLCTSSSDRSIQPTATEGVSVAVMTIPGAVSASVHPPFAYFASSRSAISYDVSSLLPYKGLLLLLRCVGFCSSIGCFLFSDMVAQGMIKLPWNNKNLARDTLLVQCLSLCHQSAVMENVKIPTEVLLDAMMQ